MLLSIVLLSQSFIFKKVTYHPRIFYILILNHKVNHLYKLETMKDLKQSLVALLLVYFMFAHWEEHVISSLPNNFELGAGAFFLHLTTRLCKLTTIMSVLSSKAFEILRKALLTSTDGLQSKNLYLSYLYFLLSFFWIQTTLHFFQSS